ncbi:TIGR04255 family protein [Flavobacterium procerum]|uniref:TIGR04255 family protein n=1 Tax=Flavobacterium procerum TaxID=1455569 RepID=A0ABV6BM81_9FLAO
MLPLKITPDPLLSSTVEIRFKSNKSLNEIFISLFSEFTKDFPKFKNTGFPEGLREKNVELKYIPEYVFSNNDYSIAFNENFIAFECVSEYKLWKIYSVFLKDTVNRIKKLGLIDEIERIGVRYGSLFENISDIDEILKNSPKLTSSDFGEEFLVYMTKIIDGNTDIILRIKKDFELIDDDINKKGHLIDIDVSTCKDFDNKKIFEYIDQLHDSLKKLFFGLLKEDFIKSLNPEY